MTRLLACPAQEQVKRGLCRGGGCVGRLSGTGVGKTACLQDDDPMQMLNKGGKCYEEIFESSGGKLLCRIAVIAKADIGTDNKARLSSLAGEKIKAALKKHLIERDMDIVSLYKHLRFKKPALFAKYKGRLYELYDDMELSVSVTLYS